MPAPAFLSINATNVSYSAILAAGRREMAVFKATLAVAAAAAAAWLWRGAGHPVLAALGLG